MKENRQQFQWGVLASLVWVSLALGAQVTIEVGFRSQLVSTQALSVRGVLQEQGIALHALDRVRPKLSARVSEGMHIRIVRVRRKVFWKKRSIPVRYVELSGRLRRGERKLLAPGKPKVVLEKWVVYYKNGWKTKKFRTEVKVIHRGVPSIWAIGRGTELASRGGRVIRRVLNMVATAYHPTRCRGCDGRGITATGYPAKKGVVAVDPRVIPLYSKLYIPGYGEALALDTGGDIKGRRIDLVFESMEKVRRFSKKRVRVYILE